MEGETVHPTTPTLLPPSVGYPECDGLPLSDNTKQLRWIVVLYGNLAALFDDRPDVFVAGNLLWYPVQGKPEVRNAPDVLVVFGRPKGDRGSYQQWEEGGVPLTVVFEVLSPSNTVQEMDEKLLFYEEHGVEEYYVVDPEGNKLMAYVRSGDMLRRVRRVHGYVCPRLGILFDTSGPELRVLRPDGRPFLTFEELVAARLLAERQTADVRREAEEARRRAARMAELGRKARRGLASAEELRELERLEDEAAPPA
jgi:Uma2 family endonuclease